MDTVSQLYMYAELALYAALILLLLVVAFWLHQKALLDAAMQDGVTLRNHYDWAQYRVELDDLDTEIIHDDTAKVFKLDEE